MLPRVQRLHGHLVGASGATSWNGEASHLFADPLPDRLKDEWAWARTRVDVDALEAAVASLPAGSRQPRVAIAGFQLESNNFAPVVRKEDFSRRAGQAIVDIARGGSSPLDMETGFFTTMDAALPTWEPVPLFNLNGGAAGAVDEAFCQEVVAEAEALLAAAGPLDAVYCPMHGGMRASETADSDGEFLAAVRRAVGPDVYVIATLDLHSNISERMVEATDCMVAMRTNPHVDTAQRGEEAACCLLQVSNPHLHLNLT
jgi:microcystin degradation protein MlrC